MHLIPENFKKLPKVESPRHIVFCDFDETYFPHKMDELKKINLKSLETYLYNHAKKENLMIGWVTGSSLKSVLEKMEKGGLEYLPHFIASGLGTEIAYFDENHILFTDKKWEMKLKESNFKVERVEKLVRKIKRDYHITLILQTQIGNSKYKVNYYYRKQDIISDARNIDILRKLANEYQLGLNINQCNPLAGDPEDCYDVDFIPTGSGKDEIVRFILEKYRQSKDNAFAFGDSGNDLSMIKSVENGYLMQNATDEAKNGHDTLAIGEYSLGILNTLKEFIK